MSSPRALANQGLYLARILLDAWRERRDAQDISTIALDQAFGPAVREHLVRSYGWFLLELAGQEEGGPAGLPGSVDDLPPVAAGKAVSGELRECRLLEQGGWLAGLLAGEDQAAAGGVSQAGNLARPVSSEGLDGLGQYCQSLSELYERMRDSLDEY